MDERCCASWILPVFGEGNHAFAWWRGGKVLTGSIQARDLARKLRRTMSLPEVLLWQQLRLRPSGLKFRRQHPAGDYVLDFFCASARLAIEVDGSGHNGDTQTAFDQRRDAWLGTQGLRVLRVLARDVLHDVAASVQWIVASCGLPAGLPLHHASHGPPPRAGEDFKLEAAQWNI